VHQVFETGTQNAWLYAMLSRTHNHLLKNLFKGADTTIATQTDPDLGFDRRQPVL
jgi:hypothetical protein